jgi:hypothetical protein
VSDWDLGVVAQFCSKRAALFCSCFNHTHTDYMILLAVKREHPRVNSAVVATEEIESVLYITDIANPWASGAALFFS